MFPYSTHLVSLQHTPTTQCRQVELCTVTGAVAAGGDNNHWPTQGVYGRCYPVHHQLLWP